MGAAPAWKRIQELLASENIELRRTAPFSI